MFWIEIAITALVAFAATFSGVYLSFRKERKRAEAQEKEQFGRLLQSLLAESANNHAVLNNIKNRASPGLIHPGALNTDALQVALASNLFHYWADYSLVKAVTIVRTQLNTTNNILSTYRQMTASRGGGMTGQDTKDLQIRAETSMEVIGVMQGLLEKAMRKFGAEVARDAHSKKVDEDLARLFSKEREQIDELRRPGGFT